MKKILKRLATGFLAFATIVTALPTTAVLASEKQYWTESAERVGIVEKVMNDGSIGSTFNEGHMTVEGEDAFCVDINTNFRNGYKTRADASTRMSYDQISDVALSIEYVNQYMQSHSGLSSQHIYLLKQCVVWQRLSVHLGWQCDNVRASYDEISKAVQDEVYAGAKAFASENKGRYECGGYIYSGEPWYACCCSPIGFQNGYSAFCSRSGHFSEWRYSLLEMSLYQNNCPTPYKYRD